MLPKCEYVLRYDIRCEELKCFRGIHDPKGNEG